MGSPGAAESNLNESGALLRTRVELLALGVQAHWLQSGWRGGGVRCRHGLQQDPAAVAELSAARPTGGRYPGEGCGQVRIPLSWPGLRNCSLGGGQSGIAHG